MNVRPLAQPTQPPSAQHRDLLDDEQLRSLFLSGSHQTRRKSLDISHLSSHRLSLNYNSYAKPSSSLSLRPPVPDHHDDHEVDDNEPTIFEKLPRRVTLPALPTGCASTRFMRASQAANVPLVVVFGGLGFVGSHIVAAQLSLGHFVRAIVPVSADARFLTNLTGAYTRLQIIRVRDPGADDARTTLLTALRGASIVVHATSFSTHGGKLSCSAAARRVVDALKVSLDAAAAPGNVVTNFIYLSSDSAVFDPAMDSASAPVPPKRQHRYHHHHHHQQQHQHPNLLTERDWFDCSHPSRQCAHPFAYAHTVAELRLWARVGRTGMPFNIVTLIPSFILGPVLCERHARYTPSVAFFASAANGYLNSVPDFPLPIVDVRDVARAVSVLSANHEIAGRVLLSAEPLTTVQLFRRVSRFFPEYAWPRVLECYPSSTSPSSSSKNSKKSLFSSFFTPTQYLRRRNSRKKLKGAAKNRFPFGRDHHYRDLTRAFRDAEFINPARYGTTYAFSQARARDELGIVFTPVSCTLADTLNSLHRFQVLPTLMTESTDGDDTGNSRNRRASSFLFAISNNNKSNYNKNKNNNNNSHSSLFKLRFSSSRLSASSVPDQFRPQQRYF